MKSHVYTQGFANLTIIIGVVLLLLIGAFVFATQSDSNTAPVTNTLETSEQETVTFEAAEESIEEEINIEETAVVAAEEVTPTVPTEEIEIVSTPDPVPEVEEIETTPAVTQTTSAGTFTTYDESLLANAEDGSVILFFHASWCPSCRALERDINSDLSAIPDGVTILQIDYDEATALKKKYGVTRQHTLVQVDADGNEIKKLTGLTNTLNQVVNQI